jgi:hypothetical protein
MSKRCVEDDEGDDRKHSKVTLDTTGHPCVSKEVIAQNLEWWRALGSNVLSEVRQVEMRNYDLLIVAECHTGQYASETSKQCRKRSKQYWQWSCETRFNANPRRESIVCLVDNCEYEDEYNPYRVMFRLKGTEWGYLCYTCHEKYCSKGGDMPRELRVYINKKFKVPEDESDDEDDATAPAVPSKN